MASDIAIEYEKYTEETRHLRDLLQHPGWPVLLAELKKHEDVQYAAMIDAKTTDAMAFAAARYSAFKDLAHLPTVVLKNRANVLEQRNKVVKR